MRGVFLILLAALPAFGVSTFRGLILGKSTVADADRQLGAGTGGQYRLADNTGMVFVTPGPAGVIDQIEWVFREPVDRTGFLSATGMNNAPVAGAREEGGRMLEYFSDRFALALVHSSGEVNSMLTGVRYMSQQRFDATLGAGSSTSSPVPPPATGIPPATQPPSQGGGEVRTGYNPKECEDVYAWARQAQTVAEKSKDRKRRQDVLEIRILSQRGECETSRQLKKEYEQKYP